MAKKNAPKPKEPVKIRFKTVANGNKSIYLDCYRDGKRSYEFLKLYLIPPTDAQARALNANTLQAANAIKAQRIIEIANGEAGITRKTGLDKILLLDWLDKFKENNNRAGKSQSYSKTIDQLKRMLIGFGAESTQIGKIDKAFCAKFLSYLKAYITRYGKPMSDFTIYLYYQCFVVALNSAVDDGILLRNPSHASKERPADPETTRTHLTIDEVKNLIDTDCMRQDVKEAFLFGCFCGLRYSDIVNLKWRDIYKEDASTKAKVLMKKTKRVVDVYLSDAAIRYMPQRGDKKDDDFVFNLPSHGTIAKAVKRWATDAGITKYVTFHTSRHTFATIALNDGKASLYVVSKMLGHKDIKTTQIYAEVLDREKEAAVNAVASIFDETQD